jgi:hypothetical protein
LWGVRTCRVAAAGKGAGGFCCGRSAGEGGGARHLRWRRMAFKRADEASRTGQRDGAGGGSCDCWGAPTGLSCPGSSHPAVRLQTLPTPPAGLCSPSSRTGSWPASTAPSWVAPVAPAAAALLAAGSLAVGPRAPQSWARGSHRSRGTCGVGSPCAAYGAAQCARQAARSVVGVGALAESCTPAAAPWLSWSCCGWQLYPNRSLNKGLAWPWPHYREVWPLSLPHSW